MRLAKTFITEPQVIQRMEMLVQMRRAILQHMIGNLELWREGQLAMQTRVQPLNQVRAVDLSWPGWGDIEFGDQNRGGHKLIIHPNYLASTQLTEINGNPSE